MDFRELKNVFINYKEDFISGTVEHLELTLISMFFIVVIGMLLGILINYSSVLRKIIMPVINVIYTIPVISMFGILIIYVGLGNLSAILALVLYGILPVVKNTYVGVSSVPKEYTDMAEGLGAKERTILVKIRIPLGSKLILGGIRTSLVMTVSLCALSALIGAGGLGSIIYRGFSTINNSLILGGSLVVAILALLLDFIFGIFCKFLTRNIYL